MPAGDPAVYADLLAALRASSQKPIGRLRASGALALADNVIVPVPFSTEDWDTHGYHDNVTNNTRVTPNVAGYYRVDGAVHFATTPATPVFHDCAIRTNGANMIAPADRKLPAATPTSLSTTCQILMNGTTDYFELTARQDSSAAGSTNQSAQYTSVLEWEFIRPV